MLDLLQRNSLGCLHNVEVAELVQIRRVVMNCSSFLILDADVDILVEFVHESQELFELLGLLLVL